MCDLLQLIRAMKLWIFSSVVCFCILSLSGAATTPVPIGTDNPRVRAVSLGGWLVTEGWIKPSLFSNITNKDFLDGTQLQLKSVKFGKYLSAEGGGGDIIVANRTEASGWETFTLWRMTASSFKLRVFNKNFVGVKSYNDSTIVAVANTSDEAGKFKIHRNDTNSSLVRIEAHNGSFLQVKSEDLVSADYKQDGNDEWGDDNPSVFRMTIVRTLQGEYQITNGYGPNAKKVMKDHWNTFIVEKDFKFINESGLNAVRIPIGWWIRYPIPPKPYVAGSLQALDNAFTWADKYGIRIILDLHAAPGSQNGMEHSSSRDGSLEWGQTVRNIYQTVKVIEFLTARYAKRPSLFAVELINEPLSPGVSIMNLSTYYKAGYDAVRKHSKTAYVVLSNRLGSNEPRELFNITKNMTKSVIDVHYYNLYWDYYSNLTVDQNIEYVQTNRTAELKELTTPNGPLVFVGEWVAELPYITTKKDLVKYGNAQLEVFGKASFGWSYWTISNVNNHWNFTWMITNGYFNVTSN